jgi:hypothetical protein
MPLEEVAEPVPERYFGYLTDALQIADPGEYAGVPYRGGPHYAPLL